MTSFQDKFVSLKALENVAQHHEEKYGSRQAYNNYNPESWKKPDGVDLFANCLLQSEVPGFVKLGTFLKEAYDLRDVNESKYYTYIDDTDEEYGKVNRVLPERLSESNGTELHANSATGRSINIIYKHVKDAERKAIKINNKHARMLNRAKEVRKFMANGYWEIIGELKNLVDKHARTSAINDYLCSCSQLRFANKENYRIR